jgi:c-di-GMP-related signal transduction protein
MNLIRDVDKDVTKQSLIKSMYEFATLTNTYLIAEGIETQKSLKKLIEIGVHYGQGYFIQKPNEKIQLIENEVHDIILEANKKKNHLYRGKISEIYISNICTPLKTISSNTKVSLVHEQINNDNNSPWILYY